MIMDETMTIHVFTLRHLRDFSVRVMRRFFAILDVISRPTITVCSMTLAGLAVACYLIGIFVTVGTGFELQKAHQSVAALSDEIEKTRARVIEKEATVFLARGDVSSLWESASSPTYIVPDAMARTAPIGFSDLRVQ